LIEQKPDRQDGNSVIEATGRDPNQVPWTAQQTFRGVLLTLVPWIAFSLILSVAGGSSPSSQPITASEDIVGAIIAFIFSALIEGIFLIAPFYYARRALQATQTVSKQVLRALGLRGFQVWRALAGVAGLFLLIYLFDELYGDAITYFHLNIQTNSQAVLQEGATQPLTVYGLLAASVFIAPFCEEIFFRGFVFTGLLKELSPLWAILISSALFAIAHLDPGSFLPLFVIGLALGLLRWRTRSTWPGIMLHMLNNGLSSILIILLMHHVNLPGFLQ